MAARAQPGPRGLGEFLTVLEQRLRALPVENLRAALIAHAERLSAGDRESFLTIFPTTTEAAVGSTGCGLSAPDRDELLADIDTFVERVGSGVFFEGWGWDDDLHDERAWGDESWTIEMDALFTAAADAFLAGDLGLAREAYGRLLDAFTLDQEVGTFCGPSDPCDMVTTDIPEAVTRYLRAVYETTPMPERAEVLYEQYTDLCNYTPTITLHALADTRRVELPDVDGFLPSWIEILTANTSGYWARDRQRLLTEATVWHAGTDGLAVVARQPGPHQPTAYLGWTDALTHDERLDDAAEAAREAMSLDGLAPEHVAEFADRLAGLTHCLGDPATALDARRTAWRAHPTRQRLFTLVNAAEAADQLTEALHAEADRTPAEPDRLSCELLLLAGRTDDAVTALMASAPRGWSQPEHPGPVVWPYLLAAATAPAPLDAQTQLGRQFTAIDDVDRWHSHVCPDMSDSGDVPGTDRPTRLSTLLARHIAEHPDTPQQRRQWLLAARTTVERRIDAVVGGKHRGAYQRVAILAVAYAEALALAEDPASGAAFVTGTRARHPRHVAFRDELDRATSESPLLPAPPPRRH